MYLSDLSRKPSKRILFKDLSELLSVLGFHSINSMSCKFYYFSLVNRITREVLHLV